MQTGPGTWKRGLSRQPHFDSDFPHGVDQFISTAATHWATMALARATAAPGLPVQRGSAAADENRCTVASLRQVKPPESGTTLVLDAAAPVPTSGAAVGFCRVRGHVHTANAHTPTESDREIPPAHVVGY